MMRIIKALALIVIFASVTVAQSDEEVLRTIVGKYFDAFAHKDWPAMQAIWHSDSPGRGQRFEVFQGQYENSELSFADLVISRIKVEGNTGSLRVSARRRVRSGNVNSLTDIRVEMAFVKDKGEWKLWSEVSPISALLNALTEAKTDEERRRLLDQEGDLIGRELLFLIAGQSDRAYAQANYARSMNLLQSQILVAERLNNRIELSDAWHKTGIIHFLQKRFDEALTAYRKSLAIDEESGRKEEVARSLSSIGLVFLSQSKFPESLEHFQRALAIYESLDRRQDVIRTVENIGNVHNEKGDSDTAIGFYRRCVQLYEESKRPNEAAQMVLKMARIEYDQSHDAAAIDLFRQAADRFIAAGNRRSLGYAYHNLANILYDQGDYNQALLFYQRSLQAEREAGTREGEAGALQGIGLIYSLNGAHQLAFQAYEQNLAIARALDNKTDLAAALQKVGGANFSGGKLEEALAAYKEALGVRELIGDNREIALALLDVGLTLSAKQDFAGALEQYNRSRQIFELLGSSSGIAAALLNIAQVYYLQRDFPRTIEIAQQAAEFAKKDGELDLFWQARYRSGKAYFRANDLPSARKSLLEAINIIETMRPQASRAQQPRFFESKIAPYLAMVDVTLGEEHGNEAYNYSQRAKIRVLTGLLQTVKTQITKTMTSREQSQERQFLGEISKLNLQLYREQERDKPNPAKLIELKAKLQKAQTDYGAFRSRLYVLHPLLKTLRGEIKPVTMEQAAALVPDPKTALLEFVETDEQICLFVFTKDSAKVARKTSAGTLKIFILPVTRSELYARISHLNQSIVGRDETVNVRARELYELLLKPAEASLAGKTHLILAPDAITWGLPFQALRGENDHFLLEDFAINYVPSLTILHTIASTRIPAPVGNRREPGIELLTIANPSASQEALAQIKVALAATQIASPGNDQNEVTELGSLYGPRQSLTLAGSDASEDRVKSELGKARVIHFATTGIHYEASPLFSLMVLSANPETQTAGSREDGLLELRELLKLNLKAEVAVMECSEWAQPRALSNRAMTAWTWAWFVAGSQSALVGQWRTDSADLMIAFHRQLKKNRQSAAFAWRAAVSQILSHEELKQPFYWAGFAMLGR